MSPDECTTHRQALDNRTNNPETPTHPQKHGRVSSLLPTPPATGSRVNRTGKRRAGEDGTGALKKRVKVTKGDYDPFLDEVDSDSSSSAYESDSDDEAMQDLVNLRAQRQRRTDANLLSMRKNSLMNPLSSFNRTTCVDIHNSILTKMLNNSQCRRESFSSPTFRRTNQTCLNASPQTKAHI